MYKSACIKVTSYVTAADTATLPLVSAPTTVRYRNMHHAPVHKVLEQKLPCKADVLLHGELVLQGNVKTVCKLGFLSALNFLHGVPECFPVRERGRGLGRQQDFRTDHAALGGVVAVLAVILAVQLFAGTVGGCRNGGLSGATFDLSDMKMKQCDVQTLL